jgi:UDPglucose 6-dehydrogenase
VPPGGTVGLLGLAYKPASHVIEAAQGAALADACLARGLRVVAFDPLVMALPGREGLHVASSAAEVVEAADVVVIATPDPAFAALEWSVILARRPDLAIVDAWRLLRDRIPAAAAARYHVLGRGPSPGADADADARLASLWTGTPSR